MTNVVTLASIQAMDPIARRLRWILEQRGQSERELSEKAGLSPVHVGMILARGGDRTAGTTLAKIAKAAEISLIWLITGEGFHTDTDGHVLAKVANWNDLLANAKAIAPPYSSWVWEVVENLPPLLSAPVNAGMIVGMARLVAENMQQPPAEESKKPKVGPKKKTG